MEMLLEFHVKNENYDKENHCGYTSGNNKFIRFRSTTGTSCKIFENAVLDKFFGTWKYESGGETFTIFLSKGTFINKDKTIGMDFLTGYHMYKKGNILIDGAEDKHSTIGAGRFNPQTRDEKTVLFNFTSGKAAILGKGTLEFKDSSSDILFWTLKYPLARGNLAEGMKAAFPVPTQIVLKRVE